MREVREKASQPEQLQYQPRDPFLPATPLYPGPLSALLSTCSVRASMRLARIGTPTIPNPVIREPCSSVALTQGPLVSFCSFKDFEYPSCTGT